MDFQLNKQKDESLCYDGQPPSFTLHSKGVRVKKSLTCPHSSMGKQENPGNLLSFITVFNIWQDRQRDLIPCPRLGAMFFYFIHPPFSNKQERGTRMRRKLAPLEPASYFSYTDRIESIPLLLEENESLLSLSSITLKVVWSWSISSLQLPCLKLLLLGSFSPKLFFCYSAGRGGEEGDQNWSKGSEQQSSNTRLRGNSSTRNLEGRDWGN